MKAVVIAAANVSAVTASAIVKRLGGRGRLGGERLWDVLEGVVVGYLAQGQPELAGGYCQGAVGPYLIDGGNLLRVSWSLERDMDIVLSPPPGSS